MTEVIQPVLLDPDVEGLIDEGIELIRANSSISEFDVHSPERAFVELMVYHREQLADRINLVPRQLLIDFLNYIGFTPRSGLKATGVVTFTISVQTTNFIINSGYLLTDGVNTFQTTLPLSIPAGQTVGDVPLICTENGTQGNVVANTITQAIGIKYPQVTSISNQNPTTGGTNEETDDEAIERSLISYNTRQALITEADFINALKAYGGQRLTVLPATNDLFNPEVSSMMILTYGLDATQRTDFLSSIRDRLAIGVAAYIDDLPIKTLEVIIDLRISSGYSPAQITQDIWNSLASIYNPLMDQKGVIWQSQITKKTLDIKGVIAETSVSLLLEDSTEPVFNSDVIINPEYAAVNLTKLTVNTDDGFQQVQTIIEA